MLDRLLGGLLRPTTPGLTWCVCDDCQFAGYGLLKARRLWDRSDVATQKVYLSEEVVDWIPGRVHEADKELEAKVRSPKRDWIGR